MSHLSAKKVSCPFLFLNNEMADRPKRHLVNENKKIRLLGIIKMFAAVLE